MKVVSAHFYDPTFHHQAVVFDGSDLFLLFPEKYKVNATI
jgi:hypothetical protein